MTNETTFLRRMTALATVIAFMFAALITRLWFLQVLASEEYRERAEGNFVRVVPIPAPRGRILDRNGRPLVDNVRTVRLVVDRQNVEDPGPLLERLSTLLGTPVSELEERYEDPDYLPYQPVPITDAVPRDVVFYIEEHPEEFPDVDYEVVGTRRYLEGDLAPHLLGYLGQINREELNDPSFSDYRAGQLVGRGGVEERYEEELSGKDGLVKHEIDAEGEFQGVLGRSEPVPGHDVILSVDLDIQRLAQQTLEEAVDAAQGILDPESGFLLRAPGGAVVVMDPNDGHVLAMASYPTYDPNVFLGGLSREEYRELTLPRANFPLTNRAIAGQYPPGSTFKPFVATAAVKAGYGDPTGRERYECGPSFTVPGDTSGTVFHNWKRSHAGYLTYAESLIQSCDTVFYRWGLRFYAERRARGEMMQHHIRSWGFGDLSGVDVPGEQEGRIPDGRWKQEVNARYPELFPEPTWLPGDNINMAIGQGDVLVTPLQLAVAYSALANGGTVYRPQIALQAQRPDGTVVRRFSGEALGRVDAPPSVLAATGSALQGVVSSASGTATASFAGFPLSTHPVAGKTGTAEVPGKQPHSWFAAYAPADDPKFVVVAVVEEGGHGSTVAAPLVRRVLEGLLELQPGEFRPVGEVTD